jgi:hypothetical protein
MKEIAMRDKIVLGVCFFVFAFSLEVAAQDKNKTPAPALRRGVR